MTPIYTYTEYCTLILFGLRQPFIKPYYTAITQLITHIGSRISGYAPRLQYAKHYYLFASQLQGTAELSCPKVYARAGLERHPPAHKMGDLPRLAHMPARLRIRSVHGTEVFWQPRSAHVGCSNAHQSLQLSPSAMISSPTVSAC